MEQGILSQGPCHSDEPTLSLAWGGLFVWERGVGSSEGLNSPHLSGQA